MLTNDKTPTPIDHQDAHRADESEHGRNLIRAALIEGEMSGEAKPFNPGVFKQRMQKMQG